MSEVRLPRHLGLWGMRAVLVLLGAAGALAIAELALRLAGAPQDVREARSFYEFRPDRKWLYRPRPGAEGRFENTENVMYRANADGFRDHLYARPKPPGVFRIVVVGDSIAFGFGVEEEEAFPKVLEALLRNVAPGIDIEVLNLGVSGYNTYTEGALLEDVGLGYEPDLVLAQFCINDLNDPTLHFDRHTRLHMGAIPDAAYPDPSQRRVPDERPSPALLACRRSMLCSVLDDLMLAWTTPSPDDAARMAALVPQDGSAGPEWEWLEARYAEMAAAAERVGARFAVLAFPYRGQVKRSGSDPVQARLLALVARRGWIVLDPLRAFRAAARDGELLFLDLWHPTPAGHRLAARESLAQLACTDALPDAAGVACRSAAPR